MSNIFSSTDNALIYYILKNNQDTNDLASMRLVSRKFREIVDFISWNMLLPLGVKIDREGSTVHVMQITNCFNNILRSKSAIPNIERLGVEYPEGKIGCLKQIQHFKRAFKDPITDEFNIKLFQDFLTASLVKIPDQQSSRMFKHILINLSQDIVTAAMFNSEESFLFIYTHHKPNVEEYQKALLPACISGNSNIIRTLIELGADPTKEETNSQSYLTAACACKCYKAAVILLAKGANSQRRNENGEKPIASAAKISNEFFELFSSQQNNLTEKFGVRHDSLMHYAALGNNPDTIEFLYNNGVAVDERNIQQETPLMIAIRACSTNAIDKLLRLGASLKNTCHDKTMAHFAAEGNNSEVIDHFICQGISVDEQNTRGLTPLMIAIRENATLTFYALLQCEASLTKCCNQKRTALDYAVLRGNDVFIDVLLERIKAKSILLRACQTAISCRNTSALNKISRALGIGTPIKYGLVLGIGAIAGIFLTRSYFGNNE
jgi:ankyrin repeat protein